MRKPEKLISRAIKIDDGSYCYSVGATYEQIHEAIEHSKIVSKSFTNGWLTNRLNFVTEKEAKERKLLK